MSGLTPEAEAKIVDDDLLRRARAGSEEPVSVLLEIDLPRPKLKVEGDRANGHRIVGRAGEDGVDVAAALQDTSDQIRNLTGRSVVKLRSARALSVRLSGAELVEAAAMPSIRAIRPNRRLASPGRSSW